ncbi:MAG: PEGA domain-containing protein [Candidatus Wallbacteria bacterium]|nr:PEGA domain-containing protein [Candidatus Wallbacteria bacterium]
MSVFRMCFIALALGIVLSPAAGCGSHCSVTFLTEPPGAEIFVDSAPLGKSPVKNARLTPGKHRMEILCPGFLTITRTIDINQDTVLKEILVNIPLSAETGAHTVRPADSLSQSDFKSLDEFFASAAKTHGIITKTLQPLPDGRYLLTAVSDAASITNLSRFLDYLPTVGGIVSPMLVRATRINNPKGNVWEFELNFQSSLPCLKLCK